MRCARVRDAREHASGDCQERVWGRPRRDRDRGRGRGARAGGAGGGRDGDVPRADARDVDDGTGLDADGDHASLAHGGGKYSE